MTQNDDKKIYVVETVSMFKMTYYVKAKSESDALDEVLWNKDNDSFIEGSQNHLDEIHIGARELTEEQFLKEFDKNNDYLESWTNQQKLDIINVINYDE